MGLFLLRNSAAKQITGEPEEVCSVLHQVNTSADFIGRHITPTTKYFQVVKNIEDYFDK
jgi:hypothetical protein